jgi:hypothetical protein
MGRSANSVSPKGCSALESACLLGDHHRVSVCPPDKSPGGAESEGRCVPRFSFGGCRRLKWLQIAAFDETRRPAQRRFNPLELPGPEILPCHLSALLAPGF